MVGKLARVACPSFMLIAEGPRRQKVQDLKELTEEL